MLALVAMLAFVGVGRLVSRFREKETALARRLYERGLQAQSDGQAERALTDFRAALGYAQDNFLYQISLARALRDSGRTAESETYLISLWERSPQDGSVNLALGRLFAREQLFDKTVQYYHYAIYGFWPADLGAKRRDTQFELVEYLLKLKAYPQVQAELISMAATLPRDSGLHIKVAQLFVRAQDYERALDQFQYVLQADGNNAAALLGAGEAAFQLGRYRTAQGYLEGVLHFDPQNAEASQLSKIAALVLRADPYAVRISDKERSQRVHSAFQTAGSRLDQCANSEGIDLSQASTTEKLPALKARWLQMEPELDKSQAGHDSSRLDTVMDVIFEIEQQTQSLCGPPDGLDQALLLISQKRSGVEQ